MGCSGSVCSAEQEVELCCDMGKQMLKLCVSAALEKTSEIRVEPPKEINQLRQVATQLRDANAKGKAPEAAPAEAPAEAPAASNEVFDNNAAPAAAEAPKSGGGLMGFVSAGASALTKVAEAGSSVLAQGIDKALNVMADQLDNAVAAIEKPLSNIGQSLAEQKKSEIEAVFASQIQALDLKTEMTAVTLVRGSEPYGEAEYQAVPGDSLSQFLLTKARSGLEAEMATAVGEAIKANGAMQAWGTAIGKYNAAVAKLEAMGLKAQPIKLDLQQYIVAQTVTSIGTAMGKAETEIRKAPQGKSDFPVTFAKVFSGTKFSPSVYAQRRK